MKIFLSPSNQVSNVGAYPKTNECEQCTRIAEAAREYLKAYNCEVMLAEQKDNMTERARKATEWGADFYLPIHTNAASATTARGTETFYHSLDTKGEQIAKQLLDNMVNLTIVKRRCAAYDSLIELNTPTCTRAYIEVDFHSNPERAVWIVENTAEIAKNIADTIINFFDIKKKSNERYKIEITNLSAEEKDVLLKKYSDAIVTVLTDVPVEEEKEPEIIKIEEGDIVKLSADAVVYGTDKRYSDWVYKSNLYVREISGNRVVVSTQKTGSVTGAVDLKYLIKV